MKSQFPYLVDLSLTNQCPLINICGVGDKCYASPVHKTEELTDWDYFEKLVDEMFKANVLEVAIGGYSEPTTAQLWRKWDIASKKKTGIIADYVKPNTIVDVCKQLKKKFFKVGITTRNYNLHKLPFVKELLENVDSIAFSISTIEDFNAVNVLVNELISNTDLRNLELSTNITVQPILETLPYDDFKKLIQAIEKSYFKVTLLGYKDFGFGKDKKPNVYDSEWIDFMIETIKYKGFGVDSQIVQDWGDELLKRGVDKYRLVGREGESTCFVDVQKQAMKPSSFTDEYYELKDATKFKEVWKKF